MRKESTPNWVNEGKTIRELIQELQSFSDQELLVEISLDDGDTTKPISLVGRIQGKCVLMYCEQGGGSV